MNLSSRMSIIIVLMVAFITSCSHYHSKEGRNKCRATLVLATNLPNSKDEVVGIPNLEKMSIKKGREHVVGFLVLVTAMFRASSAHTKGFNGVDSIENICGINAISFVVDFWDENSMEHVMSPYLAQIAFKDGYFYYYKTKSNTSKLRLVCKESYKEAFKMV